MKILPPLGSPAPFQPGLPAAPEPPPPRFASAFTLATGAVVGGLPLVFAAALGGLGRPAVKRFLGLTRRFYESVLREYTGIAKAKRGYLFLKMALDHGSIKTRSLAMVTYSPFGWHGRDFTALLDPKLFLRQEGRPLHIGCFGGGLHDEAASQMERAYQAGEEVFRARAPFMGNLQRAQNELFGAAGKTSYEWKELLALFLRGGGPGTLHVFDIDPRIAAASGRRTLSVLNVAESFRTQHLYAPHKLQGYWRRLVARGRPITRRTHGPGTHGEIVSETISFSRQEWNKLQFHIQDFAVDPVALPHRLDLAVWLESHYMLPNGIGQLALAQIIHELEPRGYLLTDWLLPSARVRELGLAVVKLIRNRTSDEKGPVLTSVLYRKDFPSPTVDALMALKNDWVRRHAPRA